MIQRLNKFIKNQQISVRNFEQKISASDGMIRRAICNNTDIQSKWITKIAENYPNLNIEWLLTGSGEMLRKNEQNGINQQIIGNNGNNNVNNIDIVDLMRQLTEKDTLINSLIKQQQMFLNQIDKLTNKL